MSDADRPRHRLYFIQPFHMSPEASSKLERPLSGPREVLLRNHQAVAHLLRDTHWGVHIGPRTPHGDWLAETREEFYAVGAANLPIVREACESGEWNGIVMLGGGDPAFAEAREIGRRHDVVVTACAHSQMCLATMLGSRFSVIDMSETHNMRMRDLVVQYEFTDRCASIRNINFPAPRPGCAGGHSILEQQKRAARGERSEMLESAVTESIAAIEEDGAEVLIFGCSSTFWLQPHLQRRLAEAGWEIPVLEGYRCALEQAKVLIDLGQNVSRLAVPTERPAKWRRRKAFH